MAQSNLFKDYWWLIVVLIVGAIIIILLGWAWVNLWEWGKCNVLLGFTAPVNNSVWEMTKIMVYPILIFFVVMYASAYHALRNPATALLLSTLTAIGFAWFWFYLYTWFSVSRSNWAANIAIWVLAIFAAMVVMFFVLTAAWFPQWVEYLSIAVYLIAVVLWSIFTYTNFNSGPLTNCKTATCNGGDGMYSDKGYGGVLGDCDNGGNGGDNGGNGGDNGGNGGKKEHKKEHKKEEEDCGYQSDGHYDKKHHKKHGKGKGHGGYDSDSSSSSSSH